MGNIKLPTYLTDNSNQSVFFDPYLDIIWLIFPTIKHIGISRRIYYIFWSIPMTVSTKVPRAINDCVPVNQTSQSPIVYQIPQVFIASFIVGNKPSSYKLVVNLSQCKLVALSFIFGYNGVYFVYGIETFCLKPNIFILAFAHFYFPPSTK